MKRFLGVLAVVVFVAAMAGPTFGQVKIDPSFQIRNSPLAEGEAIVGASGSQTITNKEIATGSTYIGGTILEQFLDPDLARDTEIPNNASFAFNGLSDAPTRSGQSLKFLRVNVGETGYEWATPSISGGDHSTLTNLTYDTAGHSGFARQPSSSAREDKSLTSTTGVVQFSTITNLTADEGAVFLYVNGVFQPVSYYTVTASDTITLGTAATNGSIVSVVRLY